MILSWDDVEPLAKATFNIWVDQPELGWAKEAWGKVTEAGLAEYDTEPDRCRVFARFMVLASFYRDWCAVARDERQDDETSTGSMRSITTGSILGRRLGLGMKLKTRQMRLPF
jgi:hypothetical protein